MPEINFKEVFNKQLKDISNEVSEFVANDPSNPECGLRMATKSEKLCRNLWKMALGYEEEQELKDGEKKKVIHRPEKWAMKEIMDRVDGRTIAAVSVEDNTAKMADTIRKTAKDLANAAAKKATDASDRDS